ncbi:type VII secretion-associated protein [Nocardia sp. NPDC050717]|uniref:type VII secretion-associated protein n=1 Tax=Nocardia sp. NPDC050717 TaxID=3157221 RepID=UPI0033E94EB8
MVTGLVTDIDVVVSESRVLARTAARHADVVPTVMPVRDGIVVGAPVGPMQPAISAFAMSESAWIGFEPQPISTVAATDAVVDHVVADLSPAMSCASVVVAHPSSWTTAQQANVARSFARHAGSVVLESIAVRVARSRQSFATSELIAVVEIESLGVTVTAVNRSRDQIEVTARELEPTLGAGEWNDVTVEPLTAMIGKVLDGYRPSSVMLVGPHDDLLLDGVRRFVAESWAAQPGPLVQSVAFTGLLLTPSIRGDSRALQPVPEEDVNWVGTLRERAAATAPSPRVSAAKVVAAAAVVVVALAVGVVVLATTRGSGADAATTAAASSSSAPPVSPTSATTTTSTSRTAAPQQHTMGRVAFHVPAEWRIAAGNTSERAALVPQTATPGRITVTYNTVADQAGYDEVLRDITARIANAEPGRFGAPERDVVFAGRRGIGYQESPGDGSVVRWYVLLDHGVQTNVGCQYGSGGWGTVSSACEEVMRTIAISP